MSSDYCIVCADPLEHCAFGPCGHKDTCSKCVLRLRSVLKNTKCVVCQQEQPMVFVTRFSGDYTKSLSAEAFAGLSSSTPSNCTLKHAQAYFDDQEHCDELRAMCSFMHPLVGSCSSLKALKSELKKRHGAEFCSICLEGRKVFVSEQVVYTAKQLKTHMKQGDDDGPMARSVGFKGHPPCHYCDRRFYGENEIFEHMTRVHEECHICKRRDPHKHVYYENYAALEQHFKDSHHLCRNQDCLDKKFIVFSTEQELKTHVVREHGGNMTKAEKKQALTIETGFTTGDRQGQRGAQRGGQSAPGAPGGTGRVTIIGGDANMPSRGSSRNASAANVASMAVLSAEVEDRMARAQISGRQAGNGSNTSSNTASRSSSMTNLASEAEFPSMAAANGAPTVAGRWAATSAPHHQKKVSGNAIDDFPALAGGSRPSNPSASRSLAAVIGKKGQTRLVNAAPSNHGNGAAFRPGEAFPALAPSAARTHDPKQAPMSSSLRRAIDSLAQKLKKRLGLSVYKDFKETTELWTAGSMTSREFHEKIVALGIVNLVPEIAATCTNAKSREELLDVHSTFRFAETASPGSAKNWVPPEVAALSKSTLSRGGGVWNCSVCTLLNSELNKTCEACGSLRPTDASTSSASGSRSGSGGAARVARVASATNAANASIASNASSASGAGESSQSSRKKGAKKKVALAEMYGMPAAGPGQGPRPANKPHPQNPWLNPNLRSH